MTTEAMAAGEANVLTAEAVLKYWQGHRKLTRRTIDAFPQDKLFDFYVGSMRPFSEMAWECIRMTLPTVEGVCSGKWIEYKKPKPTTKAELLKIWDLETTELNEEFARIPPHRFSEFDKAFGIWDNPGIASLQYVIDNEIHHRGQGYVYLRALGIDPPHFWERD